MALCHLVVVLIVAWLLFGGGIARVSGWMGMSASIAPAMRRGLLMAASAVYFLRVLATAFVFVRRRLRWSEVAIVTIWIAIIQITLALVGGRCADRLGALAAAGVALYVLGSFLNTASEYQRHLWKRQNPGKLYTAGLFAYAMHINYFGDVVLFSGWGLLTGRWPMLIFAAIMLVGFIFANIPALDRHLSQHYGEDFAAYAARTKKLVPWVY